MDDIVQLHDNYMLKKDGTFYALKDVGGRWEEKYSIQKIPEIRDIVSFLYYKYYSRKGIELILLDVNGNISIYNRETNKISLIDGATNVVKMEYYNRNIIYLRSDGTLWGCEISDEEIRIGLIYDSGYIKTFSSSDTHVLILRSDGSVQGYGNNEYGQFGPEIGIFNDEVVNIPSLSDIIQVSAGNNYSLFLRSDGKVFSCGSNKYGQLGIGNSRNQNIPIEIPNLNDIVSISATIPRSFSQHRNSLFLRSDGKVFYCGFRNTQSNYLDYDSEEISDEDIEIDNDDISIVIPIIKENIDNVYHINKNTLIATDKIWLFSVKSQKIRDDREYYIKFYEMIFV